jgi:ABC-type sugar transport system ATPase subunit
VRVPALAVERLTKSFPGAQALSDGTLEVRAREVHVLLGENGGLNRAHVDQFVNK